MGTAMREVFGRVLQTMAEDPRLVVLDADLGSATKVLMFRDVCPERFVDVGIAEQDMIGTAAGLASCGMIPVAATFSVFLAGRALDQIRNSVAYPKLNVKLVGTHAGVSVGYDGASHEAVEDIAVMRALPNMTVLCSSDAVETEAMVRTAVAHEGPVYLRISRIGTANYHTPDYTFVIGKGEVVKDGSDCTVVATGIMVEQAMLAACDLAQKGIHIRVVNMPSIKPIDRTLLVDSARKTGAVVTAEEHSIIGGLGSAVAEVLAEEYPVPMRYVGIRDRFGTSGDPNVLLEAYGLRASHIVAAVKDVLHAKG